MNIIVLGGGTVGTAITDLLSQLDHSVTIIDVDSQTASDLNEKYDVRVLKGSASQSSLLFQSGVGTADVCLAVTGNDEVNIVAASMAKAMGCRRTFARVFSPVFRDLSTFDYQRHFGIDRMMSLENLTALELARGIRNPSSVVVEQFARGGLEVREIVIGQEGKATRCTIKELGLPARVRIATIQRENRMWIANADDQLQIGDRITIFSSEANAKSAQSVFKTQSVGNRRVVIAGGGETGLQLAKLLEMEGYTLTVLEIDSDRCTELAKQLENANVILCNATHREVLEEERVGNADVFVSCTGEDENNILMAVGAKDLGAKQVLSVIDRTDYSDITTRLGIDRAVTQRDVMARQVLSYLTEGAVLSRGKLPGGLINIIEIEVMPDSKITTDVLAAVGLPDRCLVAAIMHHDVVRVPSADDRPQPGETAIILVEEDVVDAAVSFFETMPE